MSTSKKNRLKLDFTLNTNEERASFINIYLAQEPFISSPPTEEELETCANYILWGKDPLTQKNSKQTKEIQLQSKYGTWDAQSDESLEGLMDTPGFSESFLKPISAPATKISKIIFSRQDARKNAPPHILSQLETLWQQIDEVDLTLNYYELAHGKRKTEPRESLLQRITPARQQQLLEHSKKLNQAQYLKLRHFLVDLRRDQFTLKDEWSNLVLATEAHYPVLQDAPTIDGDIQVFPLGLKYGDSLSQKIFGEDFQHIPQYSEEELKRISRLIWEKKDARCQQLNKFYFDFGELEHVYQLLCALSDVREAAFSEESALDTKQYFLNTLNFYVREAALSEIHQKILDLKLRKFKNQDIADIVNKKFQKTYTANYISTIFKQKIIPQINAAALSHAEIIGNLFFPENFKICRSCGRTLLVNTDNFTRKARSRDGFSHQCKLCDKRARELKKQETNK